MRVPVTSPHVEAGEVQRPRPPTVHLVCGSTGAGKTTYAVALADRIHGVRFSIEDWMATLFTADRPANVGVDWASERINRCEAQIWNVADRLIVRGVDVVLDLGLSNRDHRDRNRTRAAQTIAESKLHFLDVSRDTRRARVLGRIAGGQSAAPFQITADMFDSMEPLFEAPTDDELYGAMILCED